MLKTLKLNTAMLEALFGANLPQEELIARIAQALATRDSAIAELRERESSASWAGYVDRQSGAFDDREVANRYRDGW